MVSRSRRSPKFLLILLFWTYPALVGAVTPPIPAHPSQYVVDLAGVMDSGRQAKLNAMLKDLEAQTTAQVVVLTLNSLEGEPIEAFSHQTAVKWGIGQKGKDNGVLITVAVKDRKYRIEVGYGLESTLPDSLVGSIGRRYLVPHFGKGNFAGGIMAAASEIIRILTLGKGGEAAGAETTATDQPKNPSRPVLIILICSVIVILAVILAILALIIPRLWGAKRRRSGSSPVFWGGGVGSGSSWGGGSSGGSSGFGGGGGDFGGGGVSGDW